MMYRDEIKGLPAEVTGAIILAPDEAIENAWRASYRYPPPPQAPNTIVIGDLPGFLLLTNRRLIFIGSKGLLTTSHYVALSISYEDVLGLECGGSSHNIRISYKGSSAPAVLSNFTDLSEETTNPLMDRSSPAQASEVKSILSDRIKARLDEIKEERDREPTQVVLDFTFLKSMLEEGGVLVRSMKCPTCGANIDMPKTGSNIRCEYCGSSISAIDLLERIKGLIMAMNSKKGE